MSAAAHRFTLEWSFVSNRSRRRCTFHSLCPFTGLIFFIYFFLTCCCCLRFTNSNISVRTTLHTLLCHRYLASHLCVHWWMRAQQPSVCAAVSCTCVYGAGQPGNSVLWLQQSGGVWSVVTCVRGGDASTTGLSLGQASWLSASSPSSLAQTQTSWQSFSADALNSSPPPLYTRLQAAPLIIQPLVRVISTPDDRQLMSSFNITFDDTHSYVHTHTHCPQLHQTAKMHCCPICLKKKAVKGLSCWRGQIFVCQLSPRCCSRCSHPYFCLCIAISCSGKRVSVVDWLVTCCCINI